MIYCLLVICYEWKSDTARKGVKMFSDIAFFDFIGGYVWYMFLNFTFYKW